MCLSRLQQSSPNLASIRMKSRRKASSAPPDARTSRPVDSTGLGLLDESGGPGRKAIVETTQTCDLPVWELYLLVWRDCHGQGPSELLNNRYFVNSYRLVDGRLHVRSGLYLGIEGQTVKRRDIHIWQ